jgi:hypothetical protein
MDSYELKPCPFCNRRGRVTTAASRADDRITFIACDSAGSDSKCPASGRAWEGFLREELIENWNRRPEEDRLRAALAEAEEKLEIVKQTVEGFGVYDSEKRLREIREMFRR